ncbi:MAG: triose-phosphate isomerase [Actinomycetia bacterium]|nr:triose-phosphate isomerase [Actinomycetes bacterium]
MSRSGKHPGRIPLMAGNWKMNLNHLEAMHLVQDLAFRLTEADLDAVEVAVLPPFTDIRSVQTLIDADHVRIGYGAQDLSAQPSGAFTGEISAAMLAKLGCRYVTVGHSERRANHHEHDATVAAKARAARQHLITPIICVGEALQVRQAGDHVAKVLEQLSGSVDGVDDLAATVIAYEPVWAIGTGEVATPEDAQEVCGAIRTWVSTTHGEDVAAAVRVLYGGSVKAANAAGIMAQPDVDGALVGGASLSAEEFVGIIRYQGAEPSSG